MDKEIDNILEGYHLKQYDLITVKQKLLVLFDVSKKEFKELEKQAYYKGMEDAAEQLM